MRSESKKNLSLFIIVIFFIAFVYGTIKAMNIVDKTHVGTSNGIYRSYVTTSKEIHDKAFALTQHCTDELCEVQSLLDFATNIPYRPKSFSSIQRKKPYNKISVTVMIRVICLFLCYMHWERSLFCFSTKTYFYYYFNRW